MREPVIEQFEPKDKIDLKLREAMDELFQQEVGVGAMTASPLKQVLVSLLRRSLGSSQLWTERSLDPCRPADYPCFRRYGSAAGSRPFGSKLGTQCRIESFWIHGEILGYLRAIADGCLARVENAPGCNRFDDNGGGGRRHRTQCGIPEPLKLCASFSTGLRTRPERLSPYSERGKSRTTRMRTTPTSNLSGADAVERFHPGAQRGVSGPKPAIFRFRLRAAKA